MDDEPLTEQYRALPERIARYPVTDPAARAAILAEIERQYRAALLEATEDRREAALALGLARPLAQLDADEEPMRELTVSLEFRAKRPLVDPGEFVEESSPEIGYLTHCFYWSG